MADRRRERRWMKVGFESGLWSEKILIRFLICSMPIFFSMLKSKQTRPHGPQQPDNTHTQREATQGHDYTRRRPTTSSLGRHAQ